MSDTKWTKEQLDAIKARGNILVSASAGSGKTAVMIERILQIILKQEAEVSEILATTFTTLAANQLKEKLAKAIKKELPNNIQLKKQLDEIAYANISTIHSFCGNLIRNYFYVLKVDASFKILEGVNQVDMQNLALKNLFNRLYEDKDIGFLSLVEKYLKYRSDEELREMVFSIYNFAISEAEPIEFLQNACQNYSQEGLDKIEKCFMEDVFSELLDVENALLLIQKNCGEYNNLTKHILHLFTFIDGVKNNSLTECYNFCSNFKFASTPRKNENDTFYMELIEQINKCKVALKSIYKDFLDFYDLIYNQKDNFLAIKPDFENLVKLVIEFKQEYDNLKLEANLLDFNDLEHFTIKLLKDDLIANDIKNKFKFIFVDEYQDVNPAQEYIIKRLENNNLFLVGDIKQSIYNFRGCDSNLFLKTQAEFEKNKSGTNFNLTKNFRSAKNVITAVNNVFKDVITQKNGGYDYKQNQMVYGEGYNDFIGESKNILYNFTNPTSEENTEEISSVYDLQQHVRPIEVLEEENEGTVVLKLIKDLVGNNYYDSKNKTIKKIGLENIAILYRENNSNVQNILKTLRDNGIAVSINTKKEKTSYPEIIMLTDLLKLIHSHGTDNIPLLVGLKWIGNLTDEELVIIKKSGKYKTLSQAVKNYNKEDLIYKKIQNFNKILSYLILKAEVSDASEVVSDLILKANLEARLGAEYYGGDKVKRLYNFMSFAKGYTLQEYIEKLALEEFNFSASTENTQCVSMMTIHSSKGLEFPVVILVGCAKSFKFRDLENEVVFDRTFGMAIKYRDSKNKVIYPYNALNCYLTRKRKREHIQEEIRLFYVALTRAESHLFMIGKHKDLSNIIYSFDPNYAKCYFDLVKQNDLKTDMITSCINDSEPFISKEILIQEPNDSLVKIIQNNLEFNYSQESVVPLKASVTGVNNKQDKIYDTTTEFGYSSAEKGSAYHKFLECWNFNENYLYYYENGAKQDLTEQEYKFLEKEKLSKICSMEVFDMIKNYDIYKEKQFFVGVDYNLISKEKTDKKVIVQGTIDLLAITDDKAIIIDYKLSTIKEDRDLIDNYKTQLALYAYAVKKLLNLEVECYLVNILSQKLIKLSKEDLVLTPTEA